MVQKRERESVVERALRYAVGYLVRLPERSAAGFRPRRQRESMRQGKEPLVPALHLYGSTLTQRSRTRLMATSNLRMTRRPTAYMT